MERNEAKKQKNWIPAEEIFNNIDLLTEILLRLQVKPLIRFKCVSKQWLSLISNPQFCVSHNLHHSTPTALLLKHWNIPPEIQIVPLKHDTIPMVPSFDRILHSCNGLFLCSSKSNNQFRLFGKIILPEYRYHYYICNPATKQFKSISFPSLEFRKSVVSLCIAFDPLKSNHYKLISIREVEDGKYQIDMYSSETDSWSLLGITFTASIEIEYAHAVFCNGAVHWYIEDETSLYFDVEKECLNTLPNIAEGMVQYFGESNGRLHLIVIEKDPSPLQFDVMEMATDYSGWFVRYHVNLGAVRIAFPDIVWHREVNRTFSVLHVIRAQKDEDSIVVIHVNNKAISCNVHDGTVKKLCDFEPHFPSFFYRWFDTYQYFEILTSV